ncbi:hypothetical protein M407DRAFT_31650 [Tulasnella calospora MUT 4182]|uniref:EH domain-containing protein n=1 Tax=Tulasnella calospora MUT 4182 TaxID=1051891 RepID=A0A0C3KB70_9AGAM|nr:hypothetical protein M407DRAFT_31650 [Tulasnella calospora MUT 4182]
MSIRDRVRALEQAAASSSSTPSSRPSLPSPRTSLTFSSDDALTAGSSSAPASPKQQSSILDDLDSFVFAGPPSSSSSPGSTSLSPHRPAQPPPVPFKPVAITANASRATSPPRQSPQQQPLISFTSPPRSVRARAEGERGGSIVPPNLPPRKVPSNQSLNSNGVAPPPLPRRTSPGAPPSPNFGGMKRSDSLTIEAAAEAFGSGRTSRHTHASSTSSFQSLSLSDNDQNEHDDVLSIDDSTATLSSLTPSLSSKLDGSRNGKPIPPPVPQRPILRQSSGSSSSSSSHPSLKSTSQPTAKVSGYFTQPPVQQNLPYQIRRTAPPPPLKPSAGSSASASPSPSFSASSTALSRKPPPPPLGGLSPGPFSASTVTASPPAPSGRRRAPIPPPARARYEDLFDRNLRQAQPNAQQRDLLAPSPELPPRPSPRSRPGWRGTSIDLRTTGQDELNSKENENKLHGQVVRRIWSCSKLDRRVLKDIWSDCDPACNGYIDREAFVQGMWRIDEELTRKNALKRGVLQGRSASGAAFRR